MKKIAMFLAAAVLASSLLIAQSSASDIPSRQQMTEQIVKQYPATDNWFIVEKGERDGWFYNYYLLLFNPQRGTMIYLKVGHSEYLLLSLGMMVTHPSLPTSQND